MHIRACMLIMLRFLSAAIAANLLFNFPNALAQEATMANIEHYRILRDACTHTRGKTKGKHRITIIAIFTSAFNQFSWTEGGHNYLSCSLLQSKAQFAGSYLRAITLLEI